MLETKEDVEFVHQVIADQIHRNGHWELFLGLVMSPERHRVSIQHTKNKPVDERLKTKGEKLYISGTTLNGQNTQTIWKVESVVNVEETKILLDLTPFVLGKNNIHAVAPVSGMVRFESPNVGPLESA